MDKTIQIWQAGISIPIFVYRGHQRSITSLAWSPDGDTIALGSDDKTVHLWKVSF